MTLFNLDPSDVPVTAPIGQTPLPSGIPNTPTDINGQTPSLASTIGAAFRQDNVLQSAMDRTTIGADNTATDPKYNPWSEIQGTKYEPYWSSFVNSNNSQYTSALKDQIDQEDADKQTLAASGVAGGIAQVGASIADPSLMLIPGGEFVKSIKGGYSVARSALEMGLAGGAGAMANQAGLAATQVEGPTLGQATVNVGAGVVLGSLLGAGGAAVFSAAERKAATGALKNIETGAGVPTQADMAAPFSPQAASAAPAPSFDNSDLTVAGGAANAVADATKAMSPNLRSNFRAVPAARQTAQELAENTVYQAVHDEGRSLGPSVETMSRVNADSRLADGLEAHTDAYAAMKKSGVNMSAPDFDNAVGDAMRNGDVDPNGNDAVTQAAQSWRQKVFEPFKQEAIQHGLLPSDVDVSTADSYFSRVYNTDMLNAREGQFKDIVSDHYEGVLANTHAQALDAMTRRTNGIDQEIADLKLSPADRQAQLDQLDAQGKSLDEANPDQIDRLGQINELRATRRTALDQGDRATAKATGSQISDIRQQGGQALKDYQGQRAALRTRQRNVDLGYAGIADRVDRTVQSLADLEETNSRQLNRLVDKGRRFEREAQRLDPDKYRARLSDLRTSFAQVAARSDRSIERTMKAAEKMRAEGGDQASADIADRLEAHAKTQQAYSTRLGKMADRLEQIENFDPEATLQEVREGVDALVEQLNRSTLARGERAGRLKARLESLDPKLVTNKIASLESLKGQLGRDFYDRWGVQHGGEGVGASGATFKDAARDIADQVHDQLTGRNNYDAASPSHAEFHVPITRGPMRDRTFNIPDKKIAPFLESSATYVGRRYARTMSSEVELTRRFGRSDLRDQIGQVRAQYADLRKAVSAAKTADEAKALIDRSNGRVGHAVDSFRAWARGVSADEGAKESVLQWLKHDEEGAVEDLGGMRDLIRGTYKRDLNSGSFARVTRGLMTFNYIRSMGNFLASNASLLYRPAMVHGLGSFMNDGIRPLLKSLAGLSEGGSKLTADETRFAGLAAERVLHGRMASFSEIGDPFARGNAVERLLEAGSHVASKWNGMNAFFDFSRNLSSMLTQHRVLSGVASGSDARYLAYLGVDRTMAGKMAAEFAQHGTVKDGLRIANTAAWQSPDAVRAFRGALSKDVGTMIHARSVGDLPLTANTPIGKLLTQFQTFNLAAHQRTTIRGLQESPARFVSGLVGMTTIGMAAAYLTALRGGADRFAKYQQAIHDNPGGWVSDGLERTGIFSLPFEVANNVQALAGGAGFRFNPIRTPLAAIGGATQKMRIAGGGYDPLSEMSGPAATLPYALAQDTGAAINYATGVKVTKEQKRSLAMSAPYGSYFGMREMIQALQGDSPY